MPTPHSILSRGMSVYSLPPALLDSLQVRSIQDAPDAESEGQPSAPASSAYHQSAATNGTLRCQTCPGAGFETVEEQRAHFKSDWHRYNAKAKLTGRAVSAEEWEGMVEGVSSISGSASSSSSGSEASQPQSKLSRLLARQTLKPDGQAEEVDSDEEAEIADRKRRAQLRTAVVWFSPDKPLDALGVPKDTQLGVHRALFPRYDSAADYLKALKTIQLGPDNGGERRITMLMVAGGHFAGMVVGLRPKGKNEKQEVKGAGDVRIIQHKTFHRYTTRKKQGGSQGLNDNAKSKAVSAGAMLRRYGEQALQEEIQALMTEWEDEIRGSERIFIRASTHGKKSFWGYEGAVLDKTDERIRTFPFPTRRPTQQELLRCWHELTRVKVSHLSEEALAALDEAYIQSIQPKKQIIKPTATPAPVPSAPAAPKLSPEEEARRNRIDRIEDIVRKGKVEVLKPLFEKYPADFTSSLLGEAASAGQEDMLRYLLLEVKLDPTIPLEGNKRAYDLSSSKGMRNTFRRIAYDNPTLFDWSAARVPSGLSEEAEAAQEKKKADRRKGMREKLKERAASRAVEEEDPLEAEQELDTNPAVKIPAPTGRTGPQKLGGAAGVAGLAGMSADMRAQIERERRARAAEARFKTAPAS